LYIHMLETTHKTSSVTLDFGAVTKIQGSVTLDSGAVTKIQ